MAPASNKHVAAQLEKLLRVRLRKCMALLGRVLEEDDPAAVHDLRVWRRRLQQVIIARFPETLARESQLIVKA